MRALLYLTLVAASTAVFDGFPSFSFNSPAFPIGQLPKFTPAFIEDSLTGVPSLNQFGFAGLSAPSTFIQDLVNGAQTSVSSPSPNPPPPSPPSPPPPIPPPPSPSPPNPPPSPFPPTPSPPPPSPLPDDTCPDMFYDFVDPECTNVVPTIIGGVDAENTRYPYMMSLQLATQPPGCFDHRCGGTLIAPNLVLTAAHCLRIINGVDQPITGTPQVEYFAVQAPRCRHENGLNERVRVTFEYVHPNFEVSPIDGSFVFDIAVLQIESSLPAPYINFQGVPGLMNGDILMALGYGLTTDPTGNFFGENGVYVKFPLQEGQVDFLSNSDCQNLDVVTTTITPQVLCASTSPLVDTCVGDSGGPVIIKGSGPTSDVQVGITSYGFRVTQGGSQLSCGGTTVYTRLSELAQWVLDNVPGI